MVVACENVEQAISVHKTNSVFCSVKICTGSVWDADNTLHQPTWCCALDLGLNQC